MEQILVKILLLTSWICSGIYGQKGFSECYDEYCLFSDGKTTNSLSQARTICSNNESWPLEIYNLNTSNMFTNFMTNYKRIYNNFNRNKIFLNMKKETSSWIWLNKQKIDQKVSVKDQDDNGIKQFAILEKKGENMYNYSAFKEKNYHRFICQQDCTKQQSGKCYYAIKDISKNWFGASNECVLRDMTLATFESMTETEIMSIITYLQLGRGVPYWIGLIQKPYKWDHQGTIISYSKWSNGYPDDTSSTICPHVNSEDETWSLRCQGNEKKIVVCMKKNINTNQITSSKTSLNPEKISLTLFPRTNRSHTSSMPSISKNDSLSTGAIAGIAVGLLLLLLIAIVTFLIWKFKPNFKVPFSLPKKPRLISKSSSSSSSPTVAAINEPNEPMYAEPIKTTQPESLSNLVEYAELEEIPSASYSQSTIKVIDTAYDII